MSRTPEQKQEHREMALRVLRMQANEDLSREQVIEAAFHAGVCGVETVEQRGEVIETCEEIARDFELERGVRKVAGWHLQALTAIRDVLDEAEDAEVTA